MVSALVSGWCILRPTGDSGSARSKKLSDRTMSISPMNNPFKALIEHPPSLFGLSIESTSWRIKTPAHLRSCSKLSWVIGPSLGPRPQRKSYKTVPPRMKNLAKVAKSEPIELVSISDKPVVVSIPTGNVSHRLWCIVNSHSVA